jgi:formiminotetrahydrofolate cyclodeaminase
MAGSMNIQDLDFEDLLRRVKDKNPTSGADVYLAISSIFNININLQDIMNDNNLIYKIVNTLSELDSDINKLVKGDGLEYGCTYARLAFIYSPLFAYENSIPLCTGGKL